MEVLFVAQYISNLTLTLTGAPSLQDALVMFEWLFCDLWAISCRKVRAEIARTRVCPNKASSQWRGGWGGKPAYVRIFVSIF